MVVRSIPQLDALAGEWNGLAERFGSPLIDHDWFVSCAEAFHGNGGLQIVVSREAGMLAAAAPLVEHDSPAGRRLVLIGASQLHEPGGWLWASASALDDLVHRVVDLGSPMILQRIAVDSPLVDALRRVPARRAVTTAGGTTTSLAVTMRGTWEEYYASLSSHVTVNLRRVRRKAERVLGPVSVWRATPEPSAVDALLETVVQVEGSGWKGRAGSSLGHRRDLRDFFRRYCHRAAARRRLHVATLSFGRQVAAVELSVEAYRRMWQLKIGYHEGLASYYPGLHLTESSIRESFDRGLEAYEFLGSAAPWEERWAPETRRYGLFATYPMTPAGLLTICRDAGHLVWRRAGATLKPAVGMARA